MNKNLYIFALMCAPFLANAQKTDPSPYCVSEFDNNYNMMIELSVGSYAHSFGAAGSTSTPNTYLYVDTAHIPAISTSANTSIFLDVFGVADLSPSYFGVWIDYDQNKSFELSELVFHNQNTIKTKLPTGASSSPMSVPLLLKAPTTAKSGKTRMRITRAENPLDLTGPYDTSFRVSPCYTKGTGANTIGCTYDFDVTILSLDIEEHLLKSQITLSPNPATDKVFIANLSTQKMTNVSVFDFSGKKIFDAETAQEINISNYTTGIYWVRVSLENGMIIPMRFVKN